MLPGRARARRRRRGGRLMSAHAADRGQLEDVQDRGAGRGVHPGAAAAGLGDRRRRRRDLRALHRPARDGRQRPRLARRGLRPEHAPRARGRLHGRDLARRCSTSSTCDGVVLGHSERRALFGETDKALALKVPAALEAGLVPILCVGETEEERDDDETDRKLRHQINEDLGGRPRRAPRRGRDRLRADLGDRHRPRRHARAGAGGDRLHPRARRRTATRRRREQRADPLRRLGQARERAPSCWRCRTSTARSSAARRSRPSPSPRSSPPPRDRSALAGADERRPAGCRRAPA